ncbi:MerR family transcriptional regulator [Streptomyces sp. T-3]|nr:MerR family transcriptional regulator [Streptomyces sp. T-3]
MDEKAPRPPEAIGVTTGAVARQLGISPVTLRSWDKRYGIGPGRRAQGRHRRWSEQDIAVLREMCRLTATGVPPAEAARAARSGSASASGAEAGQERSAVPASRRSEGGLPLSDVRQECRGLGRAAVRLDAPVVDALLAAFVARHGLVAAWEEVMAPALRAVGRKWALAGDRYVEVEHLLSWHVSTALRCGPDTLPTPLDCPPLVLACVPGEQHSLALEALAAALTQQGLPVRMFGPAVPPEALDAAVTRLGPTAVVLWSQTRSTASRPLAQHIAGHAWGVKGARGRPAMMVAGPGWAGRAMPAMLRPGTLSEALALLKPLFGTPPAAPLTTGA